MTHSQSTSTLIDNFNHNYAMLISLFFLFILLCLAIEMHEMCHLKLLMTHFSLSMSSLTSVDFFLTSAYLALIDLVLQSFKCHEKSECFYFFFLTNTNKKNHSPLCTDLSQPIKQNRASSSIFLFTSPKGAMGGA